MKKLDTSVIDQDWPAEELEEVTACPYCDACERTLGYKDVQDWTFYCAPGKWTYWNCTNCEGLYLSPRPREEFIYKAYASYYTHENKITSVIKKLKLRVINEVYAHETHVNLTPRLHIPQKLSFLLYPIKNKIRLTFDVKSLLNMPKGKLLDVGAGNGGTLKIAKALGWDVLGIEIDQKAVTNIKKLGINVIQGDFNILNTLQEQYDCVICSHVLEHVYDPKKLINLLYKVLKPGGFLVLTLPNSQSCVLSVFKDKWRGLEAPRHIAIPSNKWLKLYLECVFCKIHNYDINYNETLLESMRMLKKQGVLSSKNITKIVSNSNATIDITKIICQK